MQGFGLSTTLAVFFHEVPHNIADFAILIQNGFTQSSALKAQFVSAFGAFRKYRIGFANHDIVADYHLGSQGNVSVRIRGLSYV
jgi:zinc transporter 7